MNIEQVIKAEYEANRFLERLRDVKKKYKDDKMLFYGSKETGALKRSSMDLSRVLTQLR